MIHSRCFQIQRTAKDLQTQRFSTNRNEAQKMIVNLRYLHGGIIENITTFACFSKRRVVIYNWISLHDWISLCIAPLTSNIYNVDCVDYIIGT